jgi:hypothetical protein
VANCDNPKAVGDFGYTVGDSPEAKRKAKPRRASGCLAAVIALTGEIMVVPECIRVIVEIRTQIR